MYASARPQSASARVQQFLQEDYVMDAEDAKRAAEEAAAAWSKKRRLQPTPKTRGSDASSAASAAAPAAATLDQEGGALLRERRPSLRRRRAQRRTSRAVRRSKPLRPRPWARWLADCRRGCTCPSMPFFGGLAGPLPAPPRPQLLISEADVAVRLTSRIRVEGTLKLWQLL